MAAVPHPGVRSSGGDADGQPRGVDPTGRTAAAAPSERGSRPTGRCRRRGARRGGRRPAGCENLVVGRGSCSAGSAGAGGVREPGRGARFVQRGVAVGPEPSSGERTGGGFDGLDQAREGPEPVPAQRDPSTRPAFDLGAVVAQPCPRAVSVADHRPPPGDRAWDRDLTGDRFDAHEPPPSRDRGRRADAWRGRTCSASHRAHRRRDGASTGDGSGPARGTGSGCDDVRRRAAGCSRHRHHGARPDALDIAALARGTAHSAACGSGCPDLPTPAAGLTRV